MPWVARKEKLAALLALWRRWERRCLRSEAADAKSVFSHLHSKSELGFGHKSKVTEDIMIYFRIHLKDLAAKKKKKGEAKKTCVPDCYEAIESLAYNITSWAFSDSRSLSSSNSSRSSGSVLKLSKSRRDQSRDSK
jgi:hypothetical protein